MFKAQVNSFLLTFPDENYHNYKLANKKYEIYMSDKKPNELLIELIEIDKITPHEANERLHPSENVEILKKGLEDFDQQKPIVVDDKYKIIAGHGIWYAAKKSGYTHWYVSKSKLKGNKKRAYRVFDNRSGELSKWDDEKLSKTLYELHSVGYAVADIGFDENDYDWGNTTPEQNEKEDDVPETNENEFGVERGDIFQLGEHRLMCGDSTSIEDVDKLMNGEKADMVFTDPPYAVNFTKKSKEIFDSKEYCEIKNDDLNVKEISEKIWGPCFKLMFDHSNDHCVFYMTMPQGGDQMMMMMMMDKNWKVKHELIWIKESPVFSMGRLDYDYQHEPIIYGWKKKHRFFGKGRFNKSIWEIKRDSNKTHPTMKPIELIENAILNSSKTKELIIDYFLGSGSTLIACEKTNRRCFGMEIDPHYCSVIIKRWEEYSNKNHIKL